jgi:hypothetical protein
MAFLAGLVVFGLLAVLARGLRMARAARDAHPEPEASMAVEATPAEADA